MHTSWRKTCKPIFCSFHRSFSDFPSSPGIFQLPPAYIIIIALTCLSVFSTGNLETFRTDTTRQFVLGSRSHVKLYLFDICNDVGINTMHENIEGAMQASYDTAVLECLPADYNVRAMLLHTFFLKDWAKHIHKAIFTRHGVLNMSAYVGITKEDCLENGYMDASHNTNYWYDRIGFCTHGIDLVNVTNVDLYKIVRCLHMNLEKFSELLELTISHIKCLGVLHPKPRNAPRGLDGPSTRRQRDLQCTFFENYRRVVR